MSIAGLVKRQDKGEPLTIEEMDANWDAVDTALSGKATAAQGAKADTAVQPASLATVATSGAYADLSGKPSIPAAPGDIGAASASDLSTLSAEIATARGDRSNLNARISTISNFASPNAGGIVVGQYYDNSFQGTASSTLAGAANRFELAPYYTSSPLTIDQIGCAVSTAVAASLFKIQIYDSDANGWPDTLLLETGDISGATAAYAFATVDFTFDTGRQYWLGVRHSSTCTLRTINMSSAVNLGLTSGNASNYATVLRRTLTYATAAPSTFSFVNADRTANITPPSIRFRAA